MHYYTHNIGDYAVATKYMTFEEKGIYVDLVDHYLATGKPLGSQWLAIFKRMASEEAVENVLALCFEERNGEYFSCELDEMIESYEKTAEKNRKNAQKARKTRETEPTGNQMASQALATGNPVASQSVESGNPVVPLTNNHKPITNNQEPDREESANALPAQASASAPKAPRRKASSACPFLPGAEIPDDYREVAVKAGIGDPQKVFEKFVNHALSTDRRLVDWKAGFRTWCANETQYHPNQKPQPRPMSELTAADFMF